MGWKARLENSRSTRTALDMPREDHLPCLASATAEKPENDARQGETNGSSDGEGSERFPESAGSPQFWARKAHLRADVHRDTPTVRPHDIPLTRPSRLRLSTPPSRLASGPLPPSFEVKDTPSFRVLRAARHSSYANRTPRPMHRRSPAHPLAAQ